MKRLVAALAASACILFSGGTALASSGPDAVLTPGATDPNVTQANIQQTICLVGYAEGIRNVSTATKNAVYSEYQIPKSQRSKYVIDHLVPLEVGGANSKANLWPQAKTDAKTKDTVENLLHAEVCNGTVDLATAQQGFETDWRSAGNATAPVITSPPPPAPAPTAAPAPAPISCPNGSYTNSDGNRVCSPSGPAPGAGPPAGATAQCNDGTYSYAEHHQGACSSHGGVRQFYN
jgi:hypothetical protein